MMKLKIKIQAALMIVATGFALVLAWQGYKAVGIMLYLERLPMCG
jgi:hypothetical protein